jgi:type I restriction enzyme S subunit
MKDSGVEWIGEIPNHWEVIKLKYFCELINKKGIPNNDEIKISPENVESNTGVCFNLYSEYSGEGVKFIEHDILLNKLRLYLKKVLFSEFEGFSMGEMIVLRIRMGIPKYYFRTLFHQGLIDVLDNQSTGVKLPRVSPELIMNTNFPVPPLSEQQQIVSYLDEHTQLIDKTISVEERRIELLKEYRQSLISEVVTGKRKVVTYE